MVAGSAVNTQQTRTSENNIQEANNTQQQQQNNNNGRTIPSNSSASQQSQRQQIKQRKLTGQGLGGKVLRGAARTILSANEYALTMGTGLALGASQGELGKTIAGISFGHEIGQGIASHTPNLVSGNHYRQNTARVFNNYKAKTGMSDEEISNRSMKLLKGNMEPENDDDRELKRALTDMTNYYRATGSNEEESYKATKQVLDDITSGKQGEESSAARFSGFIKKHYYRDQAKINRKKSLNTDKYTEEQREKYARKAEKANQFVIDRQARQNFAKRDE